MILIKSSFVIDRYVAIIVHTVVIWASGLPSLTNETLELKLIFIGIIAEMSHIIREIINETILIFNVRICSMA